ncbi:MAG: hypothetical protein Q8Q59_05000 [Luteolibacter sp.]|nr:hypothetical protein [Luteolibacter sp.]
MACDRLELSGAYDAERGGARLGWPLVKDPHVTRLQLRGCSGSDYHAEDEVIVQSFQPAEPPERFGNFGLQVVHRDRHRPRARRQCGDNCKALELIFSKPMREEFVLRRQGMSETVGA